jgi:hypothetical protein
MNRLHRLTSVAVSSLRGTERWSSVQTEREHVPGGIVPALVVAVVTVFALLVLASPAFTLLGDSANALASAFHGTAAILLTLTAAVGAYQGYRLWRNELTTLTPISWPSVFNAFLAGITIGFGNWIYIAYRAPGGLRARFLESAPVVHKVFFEFKEYIALFALPAAVAAAFVIWYYRDDLLRRPWLRYTAASMLWLCFFCVLVAFVLGAAITKLQAA